MRKLIITTIFIGIACSSIAQQLPLFSQYYFNSFIYNPSHTGIDAGTSVGLVARKQFTGLDNAIGTYGMTFQTRGEDRRSGFGLYVYNDEVNLFRTNAINGSYAYHIPLSKDRTLSFGLGLSAIDHRYNAGAFNLINEGDPVVALLGSEGGFTADANAGVNMDFGKFSMGLANLQLLKSQEAFTGNTGAKALYTLANHWMFNMGYTVDINEKFELEPYLLFRKVQNAPGQVDLNLFLNWINKGYAGIAYRDGMSFSTMIGANLTPQLQAGYSFDITTSELRNALGNTHEVALRYVFTKAKANNPSSDVLANNDAKYKTRIAQLQDSMAMLKERPTTAQKDTIIIEKIVVKEVPVVREVIKEVVKEVPTPTKPILETKKPVATTPVTPTKPVVETPTALGYYVIAGSFANSSAANTYINSLARKGHSAYQKYDKASGRYYVHLGSFELKADAVSLVQNKKGSGLPLWIKGM